jgi:hypothetical protein
MSSRSTFILFVAQLDYQHYSFLELLDKSFLELFLSIISISEPILSFVTVILLVTKLDFQTDFGLFSFGPSSDFFNTSSLVNMINSAPTTRRLVPYCHLFQDFSTRKTSKFTSCTEVLPPLELIYLLLLLLLLEQMSPQSQIRTLYYAVDDRARSIFRSVIDAIWKTNSS